MSLPRKRIPSGPLPASALSRAAGAMLPLYREFLRSRRFAERWSEAVREADLDTLLRLLNRFVPREEVQSFSTNGIGFFVDLRVPPPLERYTNATTIVPGTAQFTFQPEALRLISRAIVPLYRRLASNPSYARLVALAISRNDNARLKRLVLPYARSRYLAGIQIESSGFVLRFKFPGTGLVYLNEFFYEKFG
ncbi:hypothetical protein HGI30_10920 [Paenibacillus albicereus]|uniref:Uncharacterized protein n=1 Tax=Paenibacillus albicereus TaxID=2726185 RepID=A0A6H2GX53_9BACL|nr:hypothetical protein [Paenibacillus albicereus]QJC52011.1 hypothetical protein HGI30_10920 [Paenibacillus albicereus]